jgi:hypothetical protein
VLHESGMIAGSGGSTTFVRRDGTPGRVERRARLVQDRPLSEDDAIVLQASR